MGLRLDSESWGTSVLRRLHDRSFCRADDLQEVFALKTHDGVQYTLSVHTDPVARLCWPAQNNGLRWTSAATNLLW